MGRIIALPYPKTQIPLLTGKPMLNIFVWWIGIRNSTYLSLSTWYLRLNWCFKSREVDQNLTCIGFKPQWVDAHVNNFLTIQARELKFCVRYLREKSAPLTNFQPNWTTAIKVSDFGHFICRVSLPIVPPPPTTKVWKAMVNSCGFLAPGKLVGKLYFWLYLSNWPQPSELGPQECSSVHSFPVPWKRRTPMGKKTLRRPQKAPKLSGFSNLPLGNPKGERVQPQRTVS